MSCRTCANEYNCSDTPVIYRNPYALYFVLISQQMLLVIQDAQAPMNELGQEMLSKTFRQMFFGPNNYGYIGYWMNGSLYKWVLSYGYPQVYIITSVSKTGITQEKLYSTTMLILLLGYLIEPSSYVMCKDICSVISFRELEAIQELLVISRLYTIIYCLVDGTK